MIQIGDPTLLNSPVGLDDHPQPGQLVLRFRGTSREGQVVRLNSPKCTIGSDPRCSLRLDHPGIRPVHCLIVRGCRTTVVRRWSPDTRLNGSTFADAELNPGDRLGIGPIEMEVLEANPLPVPTQSPKSRKPQESGDSPRPGNVTGRLNLADRQARRRARRLVEGLRAARAEIDRLRAQARQTSEPTDEDRAALDARGGQLRRQAERLEVQQAEFEAQRREQIRQQAERFETESRELEANRNRLCQQAGQLEAQRTELDTQRNQIREQADRFNAERVELDARRNHLQQRADQLEAQRAAFEQDRALWSRQQEEHRTALAEQEAQLVSNEAQWNTQRSELDQQRHQIEAQRAVLEENQRRHDQREAELDADRRQIDVWRAELDVRQTEFEQQQQQWRQECRDREEAWRSEREAAAPPQTAQPDHSLDAERNDLQAQRDAFEREKQQWETDVQARRREWQQEQEEFARQQEEFRQQHDRLAAKNEEIEARLTDWQHELDAREARLAEQRRALEEQPSPRPAEEARHEAPVSVASILQKAIRPVPASAEESPSPASAQTEEEEDTVPVASRTVRPLPVETMAEEENEEEVTEKSEEATEKSLEVSRAAKAHEDDDSIDDYMARLLERLGSMTGAASASQGGRPDVPAEPVAPSRQAFLSADHPYRHKTEKPEEASEAETETAKQRTTARRRSALEGIGSLAAMRELATATASSALTTHARSQLKKMSLGKLFLAVASLALGLSLVVGWMVWGFESWQFYVGVAGLFLALLWVIQYAVLIGRLTLTRNGHLSWSHGPAKPAAPRTPSAEESHSTSDAAPEAEDQAPPTEGEGSESTPTA